MVELAWYTLRSLRGHFENHFRIYIYVLEMCGGTTRELRGLVPGGGAQQVTSGILGGGSGPPGGKIQVLGGGGAAPQGQD